MTDRRTHFANANVAHDSLRGVVTAKRFAAGEKMRVLPPVAGLHATAELYALDRQSLHGHLVTMLGNDGQHAFVRDETMGYVGYMSATALGPWIAPTHRVSAPRSLLFSDPDFKSPNPVILSCGSLLAIQATEGKYARTLDGYYALTDHLAWLDRPAQDPVSVARGLLGVPYLWGGNSAFGIDCSGLVQLALSACGFDCPGDSDQQQLHLGKTMPGGAAVRTGDLFFWKGHVALAASATRLIHANAHHMCVAEEDLADAMARIAAQGDGPVLRHARMS